MSKGVNASSVKDPENIYMSDIIHILKDQKQKIDHLLRQTKQGLQQSNSRNKGFWNSSSNMAEPFSIPSKVLNDIQGYESSAGRINSLLHKKVNHLKRITMKKKTYEEIEKREREKEMFARYATPDVRMNMRNSIGSNDMSLPPKQNKRFETTANTRAGSVQLDQQEEILTTEVWAKRINAAKDKQKLEELPLKNLDNQSKQNGILKRRLNDSTRASLEEVTKIYSPRSKQKQKKDGIHGQSMILDTDSNLNMSMDMGRHTMDLGLLNVNSARNRQNSQDFERMMSKDQYIDKENNQQYLLKQVQQQNNKLTQKQNEILHRQLIEQSKQLELNESVSDGYTPAGGQRNSLASYATSCLQSVPNNEKPAATGNSFLPSLRIPKRNSKNNNEDHVNHLQGNHILGEDTYHYDVQSTQKKQYGSNPYGNLPTPDNRYSSSKQIDVIDMTGGSSKEMQADNFEDITTQIRKFKSSQRNQYQQDNITKSKRSLSVQQHQNQQSSSKLIDNEDKLKLLNKYKQSHLIENNTLNLPSENQIYPLNIFNDKKPDNQNFFKREVQNQQKQQKEGSYQDGQMIPGNLLGLPNKERGQRYSYDLNCNSVPLNNSNQTCKNEQDQDATKIINNELKGRNSPCGGSSKGKRDQIKTTQQLQNQYQQQSYIKNTNSNQNVNHIGPFEGARREYTSQDTGERMYQIKSTDQTSSKAPFQEIVQPHFQSEAKQSLSQDLPENINYKGPHIDDIPTSSKQSQKIQQKNGLPPPNQQLIQEQKFDELNKHFLSTFTDEKDRRESEIDNKYESVPNQITFTVKKEDLRLDLSKLAQKKQKESEVKKQDIYFKNELNESLKSQPFESISNQRINEELKEKLQQNFLQRLGLSGGFLQRQQELDQKHRTKNRVNNNVSPNNNNSQRGGNAIDLRGSGSENDKDFDSELDSKNKVKFNDPNQFNYHKLIGCASLDDKSKRIKPYQHYHSNEREKQEKKYYEVLNEKLNYQIQINLLFLEQSLLKSKSQSKKQLLEKLKAFRQEIVEASLSQEKSIQNLKKYYKHLQSFNLPDSLFTI